MNVFVIGLDGTKLMPCKPQKARKLLQQKKAVIYKKIPFTIKLLYKTGITTQPVTVGVDKWKNKRYDNAKNRAN